MKRILPLLAAVALIVGCATQNRTLYNTLASLQVTTSAAYNGYLDFVVSGKIPTNSVPIISRDYTTYQMLWSAAVAVAQWNTNTVAPEPVINASAKVINDVVVAKAGVK